MDHVVGPLHILLVEKEGRIWFNTTCLKLYQFNRIIWWCLCVLESFPKSIMESPLKSILKCDARENIKKNHGLPEFSSGPPLGGGFEAKSGRPCTLVHNLPCRTPCRLFIHGLFFGPLGLHLLVWSELGRSPPFWPMRALTLPWSRAFSLVCEVAQSLSHDKTCHANPQGPFHFCMHNHELRCLIFLNVYI